MKVLRFVLSPGFVMLVIISLYVLTRVSPGEQSRIFGILGFTAFAAIELVTVGTLLLRKARSTSSILAHSLNAIGALLISYSTLDETALAALVAGAFVFAAGMLLWTREIQVVGH